MAKATGNLLKVQMQTWLLLYTHSSKWGEAAWLIGYEITNLWEQIALVVNCLCSGEHGATWLISPLTYIYTHPPLNAGRIVRLAGCMHLVALMD